MRMPLRHRLDARGEARHATRGSILGHDVLGSTTLDLRLRARSASAAAFLSPALIASSTFLTEPRTRLRRAVFTAVRRSVWRARFSADL